MVDSRRSVCDAFFLLKLRVNFLSVNKILDKGYTMIFDKDISKVIDKEGNVALVADQTIFITCEKRNLNVMSRLKETGHVRFI